LPVPADGGAQTGVFSPPPAEYQQMAADGGKAVGLPKTGRCTWREN